ncbi:universal stress protein [Solitalea canadensis]|uniref:Universal stress protein UspA-like protein n=1 Tax=Solitalea canadensis (strain ATCC 29591 / DSM 3403 / JCM 21819 / LMG 8368 / NBRC 15130 / NCIMB 12057 / USAM 9D) TaxID=929556 RepID=H8KPH2_SOLCM|nr:universal stress protein [Solitalea canadensis]AFD05870.1 universal stress protein UspA-like protein [Solitalea canadensis DSM 3403]
MKRIIVATDFSAEAENATLYAINIAKKQGYELIIFSLYNLSIHALNARASTITMQDLLAIKRGRLEALMANLNKTHHIQTIPHFATGDFYEEINRCIEIYDADLLVMGMAKKSFEQDLLGNTTTSAIHKLKIPILSIPLEVKYQGIKHILFACDTANGMPNKALEGIMSFASTCGATVEIFNVMEKADAIKEKADLYDFDTITKDVIYYYRNIESTEVIKAIKQEVLDTSTDLLVMVPQKHGFWDSLMHRSKTRAMASGNNIPLLSIPM